VVMPNSLTTDDLKLFERFKIPLDLALRAGIFRVSDAEARNNGFGHSTSSNLAGIVYPYYDPITGLQCTSRLRRDVPDFDANGHAKSKYLPPFGDRHRLYFPPNSNTFLPDTNIPVLFVEAEKSAIALVSWASRVGRTVLPIATGGCYGWRGQVGIAEGPNGERLEVRGALADLGLLQLLRRESIVLFDANAATNPFVRQARWKFAHDLTALGARVSFAELPIMAGVNGPDDCGDNLIMSEFIEKNG
jgi:Domain of unknown function (DUF3854)